MGQIARTSGRIALIPHECPRFAGSARLRPDVIVRLPGEKSIVVDTKTPLDAYLTALDAGDEATRERQIADHARQVRDHVRALGSKDYWKALPVTPDFVVMFVPGEAVFRRGYRKF
jgi:DNA recombination protein RmuC